MGRRPSVVARLAAVAILVVAAGAMEVPPDAPGREPGGRGAASGLGGGAPSQSLTTPRFGPRRAEAAPAAPGFRVKVLDAPRYVDTRELIGKRALVLRFQASYCKPCARESAALDRVAARYRDRGVDVLALHVQDTLADTRRFVKRNKVGYAVALDPQLTIGNRYGFKGTPYTVVVDRKGEMVARIHGVSAVARLPGILDAIVAADRPPAP